MKRSRPSLTARRVALIRAGFDRPTSPTGDAAAEARLLATLGSPWMARGGSGSRLRLQQRTAFFDREVLRALDDGIAQVVIVAAGYDGRALRFARPGVRFFEVDHPDTQADKRGRLHDVGAQSDGIAFVPVDLAGDDLGTSLRAAGHDPDAPTQFVVEGLLGYLPLAVTERLLAELAALAAPGSRLAVAFPVRPDDATAREALRHKIRGLVVAAVGEPWLTRFAPDEPARLLEGAGWDIAVRAGTQASYAGQVGILVAAQRRAPIAPHPLDPLTAEEITTSVALVRGDPRFPPATRFAHVALAEPPKDVVRGFQAGDPIDRAVRMVVVTGPEARVTEVVASVTDGTLRSVVELDGVRPGLLFEESYAAILALQDHPDWVAAMARRGLEDPERIQIDPWPAGAFGTVHEEGRRICRCLAYVRDAPDDNGYARPVEGVVGFVDMARGEVLEVLDTGVVPLPPEPGSYYPEVQPALRDDLRALEITQPDGPSFTIEGSLLRWQRWTLRVSMDSVEGLVLHQVGYEDGGRVRPILYRASVSEMVVPYGDPGPLHGWKNAFDAGEWGLGRMANSLVLGCDCLGEIRYLDALFTTERGKPYVVANAVCIHEEDYGILWKHHDGRSGRNEVRRSRRLVVSSIATVGNYDYGFFWYLYLDGTIQFEVKLTGILSTMALRPGERPRFGSVVAPQLGAPFHQHLFNVRLDMDVDGTANSVYEVEARPVPAGLDNPWANAFESLSTLLGSELQAQRVVDAASSRYWKVVADGARNRLGEPTAYKLVPGSTPALLADPESSVGRRARFATRNLWVTPYHPDERRAGGEYPNQHPGGDGLPRWTAADRSLAGEDVVLWYTFGVTHIPRPEDWPVMPVEYAGFLLVPVGFFDRNPALDLAPSAAHCHP